MSLDRSEVARLLALAACYDQRTVGQADVLAWQAALEGVNFGECEAAIIAHSKHCRERIMPADILVRIRDAKRQRAQRLAALPTGCTDRDQAVRAARRGMADIYQRMGWTRNPAQAAALTVSCPVSQCWARPGVLCRRVGDRLVGVHRDRIHCAGAHNTESVEPTDQEMAG